MLKIIHTADWHIGQTLRGFSRDSEHRAVFSQLVQVIAEEAVDALIIAGDVFDTQNPAGDSQRLLYDLLSRVRHVRPNLVTVMTAGNHDAAGRLEAPRALFERFGVHVVGNIARNEGRIDVARHLVPLVDAKGELAAKVLAVSYPTAACLPPFGRSETGVSPIVRAVTSLYAELFEAAFAACEGLPVLATGHLHIAGGLQSEGAERRILIGGEHAVPADVFPPEAAYVALGHLHRAQQVGRANIRYSGSLFPLSATEQPYRHGVTLLTLEAGRVTSRHVPLTRPVPFLRLPAEGAMRLDDLADHLAALALDPALPLEARPFIDVRLSREGLGAGFRAEVDRIGEAFPVRIVDARIDVPTEPVAAETVEPLLRLAEHDPQDMFRRAFEKRNNAPPSAAHLEVFQRLREGL
ncbi:MAG: metallophosphoesterase family protein [Beijerinckiaceae bacterium]